MFRSSSSRSRLSRLCRVAGVPVMLGILAAPLIAAAPDEKDRGDRRDRGDSRQRDHDRDFDRYRSHDRDDHRRGVNFDFNIGFGRGGISVGRREVNRVVYAEQVPANLQMTAYQARDTVIVIINGVNHTGGFTTTLSRVDSCDSSPDVNLCNIGPTDYCSGGATAFSVSGSFRVNREIRCITVRVAGQAYEVPVTCVQSL